MHSSTQKTPFEVCLGYFPKSPMEFVFGEAGKEDGQMIQIKIKGSFKIFNRYIKQYRNNWRRAKPSIRQGMINIGLIISLKSVIKYGYISTKIE
jgi:hypothetical protein